MRRALARGALALLLIWAALPARAQEAATALAADVIRVESRTRLVAEGNVQVFAQGRQLRARRLSYDRTTDRLTVEGPITLQEGEGVLLLADGAQIDGDLRAGMLQGARLVLDQQLQIAGADLRRSDGRFNDLRRVVASSCSVCAAAEAPLWEIRARRVVHDEAAQQIYFYDAQFRVLGVPLAFIPALRVPDPRNTRAAGFLTPSVRTTSQLGVGLKWPYFIPLGDHVDVTLTPYISTGFTRTLEARYRQAFSTGTLVVEGAVSRDDLGEDALRRYLFAEGVFDAPRGFDLRFGVEVASDDAYLSDYDYSSKDRLETRLGILRSDAQERIEADVVRYQSLREGVDNSREPSLVSNFRFDRRLPAPARIGGWLDLGLRGQSAFRTSSADIEGRDVTQLRATAGWQRRWTGPLGLRFSYEALVAGDLKEIGQDSRFDRYQGALTPTGAVTLRWPLARSGAGAASWLFEPVAQVAYTPDANLGGPNDDSTKVAFDTGNLLSLNRFPGLDRTEEDLRANLAIGLRRIDPSGLSLGVTLGKVYRRRDPDQFPAGTGLADASSDWLTQLDIDFSENLTFRSLLLIDTTGRVTLNETRIDYLAERLSLSSAYVWQLADNVLELDDDLSEIAVDASLALTRNWSADLDLRRDFIAERTNRAGLSLGYTNECVRVDLSVLRRFRTTGDNDPTTSYGLSVSLSGFGDNEAQRARRRSCSARG